MKPILLIGHDPSETFGLAPEALADGGATVITHRAETRDAGVLALDDVSGIVLFGGEMNADQTDRHPFLRTERELVRQAVDRNVPYLGICLGAQILARALDSPVLRAPVKELGFTPIHPTGEAAADPLLSVFSDGDMVFHWHEDTFELPAGAVLLATGDEVPMQAYRAGTAWGLQFHFEVDQPELELWLKNAGDAVLEAWGKSAERIREEAAMHLATQEERARAVFGRFAEVARAAA